MGTKIFKKGLFSKTVSAAIIFSLLLTNSPGIAYSLDIFNSSDLRSPSKKGLSGVAANIRNELSDSPIEAKIGFVYQEHPQSRISQVIALLRQIEAEKIVPWPSKLPGTFAFSDFHGDEKRLRQLLSYKLYQLLGFKGELRQDVSVERQLNEQGLSLKDINGSIVFGGDYPDRGPYGLRCFFIADEIIKAAPDRNANIAGNHDIWAEGNLSGYHLPVRKGFNFYGDETVQILIKQQRMTHPEYFDSVEGLLWWAGRFAEYNELQEDFQKKFTFNDGKNAEMVRKEFLKYYETYASRWNEEEAGVMRDFIGHFPHIDVPDPYLGLNGIGKTSAVWWDFLLGRLASSYASRKKSGLDSQEEQIWNKAAEYAVQIKNEVTKRLKSALDEGKWWYRVFESINTQAYESPEWWFANWSIRKDWGGAIFKELNELIADKNITHPLIAADREVFKEERVTPANYHKSLTLKAFAGFIRGNANFYFRNPYAVMLSHSYFPVESDGRIIISYKGRSYVDGDLFEGLKAVSSDYKKSTGSFDEEMGEARILINSWYADKVTRLKPRDEKRYRDEIGIAKIQSRMGVNYWGTGHNPVNKLKVPFVVRDKNNPGFAHFHTDFFMAEKYGGNGATVSIGPDGIKMSGFRHKNDVSVRAAPQTVVPGKEGKPAQVIENPGISREEFIPHIESLLGEELLNLIDKISPDAESLARIAAFAPRGLKQAIYEKIAAKAKTKGVWLDSPQKIYEAAGKKELKGTIPAINIRGLTFDTARAVFRAAKKNNSGAFIFEIARSEIGYTDQRPAEYSTVILSAAMAEGYKGPVFIQLDHCQINAKKYAADKDKEIKTVKELIQEAVTAGFYSIDIDTSTLVDLTKPNLTEQQRLNFEWAAELTAYIRLLQPKGINIAVGGEIGEVGKKNSTVEELKAFMDGYNQALAFKGGDLRGISKISVQTGTSHGGVPLPDGTVAQVKLDFNTLEKLSMAARDEYGLAGAVQHGASTLPPEAFDHFPRVETAEVHLATEFQNIIYENTVFPSDFKAEIYDFLNNHPEIKKERKPEETDAQFLYKVRKNGFGPFKERFWNLPESVRGKIGNDLEAKFDFLFKKLSAADTLQLVSKKYVSSSIQSGFDNTPYPNFVNTEAVYQALKEVVEFDQAGKAVRIINEQGLRGRLMDDLAYDAVFNANPEVMKLTRRIIRETGALMGIIPQSVYGFYSQKSKDPRKYTVPALNMRGLGYDSATALYKAAKMLGISYIIPEIARSEIGYTGQRPEEYVIVNLAGAIKAGYDKPVYIQADHFQIDRTVYAGDPDPEKKKEANPKKAIEDLKALLKESLLAGFGQVDLDLSTMVDWSKDDVKDYDGMQKLNYILSAYFTLYTRYLEKTHNLETVNLGAEIGEVGKGIKGRDSSVEDYRAFMAGYNSCLDMFKEAKGYESLPIPDFLKSDIKQMRDYLFGSDNSLEYVLVGISKLAVQAGTSHGKGGKANFKALAEIGKAAREDGLAGVVFHGASKTDLKYFPLYAGKDVEGAIESGVVSSDPREAKKILEILKNNSVAEVHLATEFQDVILNAIERINPAVYLQIEAYIKETLTKAGKWPQKEEERKQALRDKDNRKNVFGPLKAALHNLSDGEKEQIRAALEKRFVDFLSPLAGDAINDTWSQKLSKDVLAEFDANNEFGDFVDRVKGAVEDARPGAVMVSANAIFENAAAVETLEQLRGVNHIVVWAKDQPQIKKLKALDAGLAADAIVLGMDKALEEIGKFNIPNDKITVISSQNDFESLSLLKDYPKIEVINIAPPQAPQVNIMPLVMAKALSNSSQSDTVGQAYLLLRDEYAQKYNIPPETLAKLDAVNVGKGFIIEAPRITVTETVAKAQDAYQATVNQV